MSKRHRLLRALLPLLLLVSLAAATAGPHFASQAKAHPLLLEIAALHPDQQVAVIVQKQARDDRLEARVEQLGGNVTKDLHIINAFAAEMSAKAALKLAKSDAVRWVSLDAPVGRNAVFSEGLADWFNTRSYSNNDGTKVWASSWIEINDDGQPDSGKVKIDKDTLKLEDKNKGIQRNADLSLAETAVLSFSYRRDRLDKPSKYVDLQISTDGAATWSQLHRFGDGKDSNLVPFSTDISAYRGGTITLRFISSPDDAGKLYIDDLKIEYCFSDDPPALVVTNPAPDSRVNGVVQVGASATDDNGIVEVRFYLDSISLGVDYDGSDGWSVNWDTNGVADGNYTLTAEALDSIGQTASDSILVAVANVSEPFVLPPLPGPDVVLEDYVYDNLYAPAILDYRHNSGTRNFTSPWTEIGENDGHNAGNVRYSWVDYWQRIQIRSSYSDPGGWNPVHGIWRSTDLSTGTTAVLSLVYKRSSMEGDDYVALEASSDGGATWYEVDRYTAANDSAFQTAQYNISPLLSANFVLRFVSNFVETDYSDTFYFDEVRIDYDPEPIPPPPYTFLDTLNATPLWDMGIKGSGVVVAVIDSGMAPDWDFQRLPGEPGNTSSRLHTQVSFNDNTNLAFDTNGHGTHVAGIIGGSGQKSNGLYKGIAPNVGFISLKVSDDQGAAYESDVVEAMQWVYDNNAAGGQPYFIKVVNMSLNSSVEQSYHTSPLSAAAEILWFNGVVVIASAGNTDPSLGYNPVNAAPANDPFIITVGASDENGTADRVDDSIASFSAFGTTMDGFVKPDIIAPGKDIIATLAVTSWWRNFYLSRFLDHLYFRASGTSMAAPMVTGAVALLLQDEPNLTPDQVKYRLLHTGSMIQGTSDDPNSYPYLDVYAAVTGTTTDSANTGLTASQLLWSGNEPITWASVAWNSVAWNSVAWNSVAWNSVAWNSVAWNSVYWGP